MLRRIPFLEGEYYHIYNRGTDKRVIFNDDHDYRRFVALLYLCNSESSVNVSDELKKGRSFFELMDIERGENLVSIGAYCLMPNHFHILLTQNVENGISDFMKKVGTGYSMYFNKRNERSGALFEGRFKAKHVDDDNYLKYLYAYIHLNPIKNMDNKWSEGRISNVNKSKQYLSDYKYSSYSDYIGGDRVESKILKPEAFPDYFSEKQEFEVFLEEWLNYEEDVD